MRRGRLWTALIAALLTVLGASPATAASPWEDLQISHFGWTVASDGSCDINAQVLWSNVKPGRPLDIEFQLADADGVLVEGGAAVTVAARDGRAEAQVSNPQGLTEFKVQAVISTNSFVLSTGFFSDACPT